MGRRVARASRPYLMKRKDGRDARPTLSTTGSGWLDRRTSAAHRRRKKTIAWADRLLIGPGMHQGRGQALKARRTEGRVKAGPREDGLKSRKPHPGPSIARAYGARLSWAWPFFKGISEGFASSPSRTCERFESSITWSSSARAEASTVTVSRSDVRF